MKKEFIDAIEANDVTKVRLLLSDELMLNPHSDKYQEMKEYAEKNLPNLYEEHDGTSLEYDEGNLTMDFLMQIKNDLDFNFSKERLVVFEKVARMVLSVKENSLDEAEPESNTENQSVDKEDLLLKSTLVAGIGTLTYGMIKGNSIATLAGGAAALASGVKLYKNKKNGK